MKRTFFILILSTLFLSCASQTPLTVVKQEEPLKTVRFNALENFFDVCEKDFSKVNEVINRKNLVKNLTHLQLMNSGGSKYYLLERENISEMIKAVTKGLYSDIILINPAGTIIYTMTEQALFSKNATLGLPDSPYPLCFSKSIAGAIHVEDLTNYPRYSNNIDMYISSPVRKEGVITAVMIFKVSLERIEQLVNSKTRIIGKDGLYRIAEKRESALHPYPHFSRINSSCLNGMKKDSFRVESREYSCIPYQYRNLYWIIISER